MSDAYPARRWFDDSKVVDAPEAAGHAASFVNDQYSHGEPGHTDPSKLRWLEVSDYPIARINNAVDAEWFEAERRAWAEEGQPDRYDAMLDRAIEEPVVIYDDGNSGWLWDGNHRLGATVSLGRDTILAYVGVGHITESEER